MEELFSDLATDALANIWLVAGIVAPVLVALIGIGVGLRVAGKFGARR